MHKGLNMLSGRMHGMYKTKVVNNGSDHSLLQRNISVNPMATLHAFMNALTSQPKSYCNQRKLDRISSNLISEPGLAAN